MKQWIQKTIIWVVLCTYVHHAAAYPIDGFLRTGIRRLERLRLIVQGILPGTAPPKGALKTSADIILHLQGVRGDSLMVLPTPDASLQRRIDTLFINRDASYSLALLDITSGRPVRYAQWKPNNVLLPGSIGKLLVAVGVFTELARLAPDEDARLGILRERMVVADRWIQDDEHKIPVFDPETHTYVSRLAKTGDTFSLFEWMDHMLSASANAAASLVWKEAILMRVFGESYPPYYEEEQAYFRTTPKQTLSDIAFSVVNDPLREIGIGPSEWQLGSFFTKAGKSIAPSQRGSCASPLGLLKFLIAMERGIVVDTWSSLEIKRLMYMTARRIRYASSPALTEAAVYFKSGSHYKCREEPGFTCEKYMGNVENGMNSVAIVEHPDGRTYMVVLMSNVLRKNSAVEHQTLATYLDRALKPFP